MSRDRRGDGIQEVVGSIPISSTNPRTSTLNGGRKAAVFVSPTGGFIDLPTCAAIASRSLCFGASPLTLGSRF